MDKAQTRPQLRLCMIHSSRKAGGYQASWHKHTFYELGIMMEGTCDWHLDGRPPRRVQAGQMILIPPGCLHREEANRRIQLGWLGFQTGEKIPSQETLRVISQAEAAPDFRYLLLHLYGEQSRRGFASAEICALTLEHLLRLFRRSAQKHRDQAHPPHPTLNARQIQMVQSLAAHLESNPEHPLSLEQLAGYHRLSAPHLSVLFQSYYQITPTRYRQRCRIEKARERLVGGPESVKEIARACGFTDPAHFCKEFKKQTGQTPTQTRNSALLPRRM